MLRHIFEGGILRRTNEIMKLCFQICVENPVKIDTDKITETIELINLKWILAFCRKGYNSFSDINFKDNTTLSAMAEAISDDVIDTLQFSGRLDSCLADYYSDPDLVFGSTYKDKLSYRIPPEILIPFLKEKFNQCLVTNPTQNQQDSVNQNYGVVVTQQTAININVTNIAQTTNHIDNSNTNFYQFENNIMNNHSEESETILTEIEKDTEPDRTFINGLDKSEPKQHPKKQELPSSKEEQRKKSFLAKLKIDPNRPSIKCKDKSQRITLEFEEIIINEKINLKEITIDSLWDVVFNQTIKNLSDRYERDSDTTIRDKQNIKKVWNLKNSYSHRKKVLKWYKSFSQTK